MQLKVFALILLLALPPLSPVRMDEGSARGMGMGRHHRGMGPMMGRGRNAGENPEAPTAASVAKGKTVYQSYCLPCHGPGGRGDGPAAAGLNPPPPDLTRSARMLPDGVVAGVILDGRGAMPSFKAALTREQVWHLTNYVKTLTR